MLVDCLIQYDAPILKTFLNLTNDKTMAETTTGVTISQLSKATTLQSTDTFELERNGAGYSVTYGSMVNALKESLGILELKEALTEIIG